MTNHHNQSMKNISAKGNVMQLIGDYINVNIPYAKPIMATSLVVTGGLFARRVIYQNSHLMSIPSVVNSFEKRQKELEEISDILKKQDDNVQQVALVGISGSGKTEMAKDYALTYQKSWIHPNKVYWVQKPIMHFLNAKDIESAYQIFARRLNLKVEEENKIKGNLIHQVNSILMQNPGWLIIFDDVDDYGKIEPYIPANLDGLNGTVLFTSQSIDVRQFKDRQVNLNKGMETEAVSFLTKLTGLDDASNAQELAKQLGYLPLALMVAGLYIKANRSKSSSSTGSLDYIAYKKLHAEEFQRLERAQDFHLTDNPNYKVPLTQYAAIKVVTDSLSKDAKKLLTFCGLLNKSHIPKELITLFIPHINNIDKVLKEIYQYSLLNKEKKDDKSNIKFFIHEITQQVFLQSLVNDEILELKKNILTSSINALSNYKSNQPQEQEELVLHLQDFYKNIKGFGLTEFIDTDSIIQYVNLLIKLANHYRDINRTLENESNLNKDFQESLNIYNEAQSLLELLNKDSSESFLKAQYEVFINSGINYIYCNRYNKAIPLTEGESYLKKAEGCYQSLTSTPDNNLYKIRLFINYGLLYSQEAEQPDIEDSKEDNANKAISSFKDAEKLVNDLTGNSKFSQEEINNVKIHIYNNLGSTYHWLLEEYDAAEKYYTSAINLCKEFSMISKYDMPVGNLVALYQKSGKDNEARALLKDQRDWFHNVFGANHQKSKQAEEQLVKFEKEVRSKTSNFCMIL